MVRFLVLSYVMFQFVSNNPIKSHFPVMYRKFSQYMKLFIKLAMNCIENDNQRALYSLVISSNLEDSSTIFIEQQSTLKVQSDYISPLKF